ncbi:hypothetical protein [Vibrio parahaemolyticus]|uniref:hypothetical protein n=1 Tax=Vibrio parahaemolyticus TaxID=670 RepID=UPI0004016BCF|nr:hypothetical protein [Vibrio parahaemolyticus]KJR15545.1 hypothetical protein UF28_17985 [Vibrio parahaemolyticus]
MMMMTNPIRLSVISALDEGLAYSHSDYFAPLLMQGISAVDDAQAMTKLRNQRKVLDFKTLIERNKRNTTIPT